MTNDPATTTALLELGAATLGESGAQPMRARVAAAWTGAHTPLRNWACGAATVLGLLMQFLLERRRKRQEKQRAEDKARADEEARRPPPPKPAPKPWYAWPPKFLRRRAA